MTTKKEKKLREKLNKQGLLLRKDQNKEITVNHLGGYMIVDINTNTVVAGSDFELTPSDIEDFLKFS